MKDGIGEGCTRADHQAVANQLFSSYAKVGDARALASVIGEDELSALDKKYLAFGKKFEKYFVGQREDEKQNHYRYPGDRLEPFCACRPERRTGSMWIQRSWTSIMTNRVVCILCRSVIYEHANFPQRLT